MFTSIISYHSHTYPERKVTIISIWRRRNCDTRKLSSFLIDLMDILEGRKGKEIGDEREKE